MKCQNCLKDFEESNIETSHDVPLYLFPGITRNERKQQADKYGRKNLCIECHDKYENKILKILYHNLLGRILEDEYLTDRLTKKKYFPKIWRLPQTKKNIGIKICLKIAGGKI